MNPVSRGGTAYGLGAYLLWGAFPLYFRLLHRSGALEIVLHRILWALVICLAVVALTRRGRALRAVLRSPSRWPLTVAAVLLATNWGVYIYAVNSGQVVEAALGYFVNPLVTVMLGVVVLRERLRAAQWAAVAVAVVAVAVLTVAYGRPPLIALALAGTFGLYGLIKKRVGGAVDALSGLATETIAIAPLAAVALVVIELRGGGTFTANPPWQAVLLASTGLATVGPLLLFAAAARRVPLTTMGLLQYLTPVLQFLCGVVVLHEHMPAARWVGFALVWVALVVLTADSLRSARSRRLARSLPEPVTV